MERMTSSILDEVRLRNDFMDENEEIASIYFGGGTPSILPIPLLAKLIEEIFLRFKVSKNAEITLEANPDDISIINLLEWDQLGFNRLSVGIQSFNQDNLLFSKRIHSAKESIQCLEMIKNSKFSNFSIDLIYGFPNQKVKGFEEDLKIFQAFDIPHLSAYALTVEDKTLFQKQIKEKMQIHPKDDLQAMQFQLLNSFVESIGYEHYEISNIAKKGKYAIHNTNYWFGKKYLGLGPAANGFDGKFLRYWNKSNNSMYMNYLEKNELLQTSENLSPKEKYNELMMTRLRTQWGFNINELGDFNQFFQEESKTLISEGKLSVNQGTVTIPKEFWFEADGISSSLMFV